MSSINIHTLVPSLYQCVETRSIKLFRDSCLSYFRSSVSNSSSLANRLPPSPNGFTRWTIPIVNRKHFFINIPSTESSCSQLTHNRKLLFGSTIPQARSPFWLLKSASEHAHARLLPTLSRSWTALLPRDTQRKCIISIAAVLPIYCVSLVQRSSPTKAGSCQYSTVSVARGGRHSELKCHGGRPFPPPQRLHANGLGSTSRGKRRE
jgi:hypothetical protein